MEVVDDDEDGLLQLREAVQQLHDERCRRAGSRRSETAKQAARRNDALDGREPFRPERRLTELRPRAEPGDLSGLAGEPRREQRRLSGACRRGDERKRTFHALVQQGEEPRAKDQWSRRPGNRQIRCRDETPGH